MRIREQISSIKREMVQVKERLIFHVRANNPHDIKLAIIRLDQLEHRLKALTGS